jgi:hypothetical protein
MFVFDEWAAFGGVESGHEGLSFRLEFWFRGYTNVSTQYLRERG